MKGSQAIAALRRPVHPRVPVRRSTLLMVTVFIVLVVLESYNYVTIHVYANGVVTRSSGGRTTQIVSPSTTAPPTTTTLPAATTVPTPTTTTVPPSTSTTFGASTTTSTSTTLGRSGSSTTTSSTGTTSTTTPLSTTTLSTTTVGSGAG